MLTRHYLGEDRVGPANVHANDPDGILANAVAGAGVDPPVPNDMTTAPMTQSDEKPAGKYVQPCARNYAIMYDNSMLNPLHTYCLHMSIQCAADGGVDEVDLMVDPDVPLQDQTVADKVRVVLQRAGHSNHTLLSLIQQNSPLAAGSNASLIVGSHPSMFPYNKGLPPDGMSVSRWASHLLQRCPREQFAQNPGAIADMFNSIQRQQVNTQAHVQFNMQPHKLSGISCLSEDDINVVLEAIASGAFGERLTNLMAPLPSTAWDFYNSIKAMGGRIIGTPQSFAALRSKVMAPQGVFGPYTCSLNLCPSEVGSEWTFRMAGYTYEFDLHGNPTDRPHTTQCYRIIAENPVAVAEFLHCYMRAFCAVMLGWPMDSDRQENTSCLFGVIKVAYLKYESSTRGGKHAHGQILQPVLQAVRLQQLMEDGMCMEHHLYGFMESFMTAYFPVPTSHPSVSTSGPIPAWVEHTPMRNGKMMPACCQDTTATTA